MKALTNILSHLLMLLMLFIVACTEETAEVDNLSRQEQYVTVRMNIPGMTATATRAADGVIESITALAFDDADKLLEIETITTVNNINENGGFNGTFNLTVPNGATTIHFLANLPDDVKLQLPTEMGGSEVDVMTSFTTDDFNNLCYWGMTTTWDGNTNPLNVTLYRNLAKISIKPSITDTEFNQFEEEDLIIAGLINPNRVGKLVPYNNSFPQSIGELIYNTLPDNPNPLNRTPIGNEGAGYGNWLYVLEHENSNYEEYGLFVICKIGDYFYNVALTSDGVNPYPIIRNHEYIIYVSDVDDYQSEEYRSTNYSDMYDTNTSKILKTPINLEVKQKENASLTLTSATNMLYYGDSSEEAVTVTVSGIVEGVESLTLTAPGFSVLTDYATLQDGKYILDDGVTEIDFTLTLTDPTQAGTISVTGEGEYVNITNPNPITITPTLREEVDGEIVLWQGAVKMHVPNGDSKHAAKILIPYSFFFDAEGNATVPAGSKVHVDYSGTGWFVAYTTLGEWQPIWNIMEDGADLVLTEELLTTLKENRNTVWNVDAAFLLQGGGPTMTKLTLIPAKESIEANITNGATLYYDSNEEQTVTVNVTIPSGVTALNIKADDFSSVKQGDTSLEKSNDDVYVYTRAAEKVATEETIPFVLTLNRDKFSQQQYTSTDIIFSDGSSVEENAKATQDQVSVSLKPVPVVSFQYDANNTTLYWSNGNPTSLQVNMNNVPQNANVTVNITNAAAFTITSTNGELTGPVDGVYTYTGGNTSFIIKPASEGSVRNDAYTIGFSGSGENVTVEETNISVTVEGAPTSSMSVTPTAIINLDENQTSATLTLRKPADVQSLKVDLSDYSVFNISANGYNYDWNDGSSPFNYQNVNAEEVNFTFTVKNSAVPVGDYTITFYNNGDLSMFTTATISLTRMFVYNNKTQYLKDYLGNDDPTSMQVTFNAPSESSTLSISAGGFNVRAEDGQITGNNGTYTYTGGPTVFTFTPTETGTKSIVFDGTDIVDTTIDVKVEEKREIFIYNDTGFDLNGNYTILNASDQNTNEAYKSAFTPQAILIVDYNCNPALHQNAPYLTLQTNWNRQYGSYTYKEGDALGGTFEYTFSEDDFIGGGETNNLDDNIKRAGLKLVGGNVTITKIRIIPTK